MKKFRFWAILLSLAIVISSFVLVSVSASESDSGDGAPYEYVVVLGVDALGNFTMKTETPNIDRIFSDGATTNYAVVENPSSSAEGWGSLLIGTSCDVHGLTNYSIMEGSYSNDALPTVFKLLKDQKPDAKMASFCAWNSINKGIIEDGIKDLTKKAVGDAKMSAAVADYLTDNGAPDLLFCQFNNLDAIGHNTGYGTEEFLVGLTEIDGYIGDIYKIYEDAGIIDKTLFIVTGDHGGIGTTHGGMSPEEKYVFYGVCGEGVNKKNDLDMLIRDTASIVCHALGIEGTEGWDSYIPEGLFVDEEGILKRPPSAPELIYPSDTPAASDENYIGNFIDLDDLKAGFFFDGDLSNFVSGSDVEMGRYVGAVSEKNPGTIYYPTGLYGSGVKVSYEGYLATDDLALDNNSFSIGLWVMPNTLSSAELLWSTKRWTDADGVGNFEQQGLLIRNVYTNSTRYFGLNMGSGKYSVNGVEKSPASVNYYFDENNQYTPKEWVHTLMVVDRDAKLVKYYVNFELAKTIDLSNQAWFTDDYDIDPHSLFVLGQDITGVYPKSLEGRLDDLLIWNTAVDADTVASLKAYYSNAFYDVDYKVDGKAEASAEGSDDVTVSSGVTNTDNTPYTEFLANALGAVLNSSAIYEISGGYNISDYSNPKYYVVDFDISTRSNYLPMNFVSVISGDSGSANIDSPYNRITPDGVLVGAIDGIKITRTLSTSPYNWQHITLVYDLVDGEDGYPLYIYYNGDLISNAEWISSSAKANGETPSYIECTRLLIEEFATNADYYATTLIANASSGIFVDDKYENLEALFTSGASIREANKIFDLVYGAEYALPAADNMFSSNGVGYRKFSDALASGNKVIDILHDNYYEFYTITDPCTVRTNGYHFAFEYISAIKLKESEDSNGNKVYAFEAESPLYIVTASDGAVKNYYSKVTLNEIITAAASGSTIKLFSNVETGEDIDIYSKTLNIDLNGYTVTNDGGYIRLFSGTVVNVYNGSIQDSEAKEFIYLGNGVSTAKASISNCTITASRYFAEVRSGTLNLTDCTYKQTTNFVRLANCASGGSAGDKSVVNIDGCEIDLGSALLVSAERAPSYPVATDIKVTINDSEIKTTGNLFHLKNTTEGAADSVTEIKVTGDSKLAFSKFDVGGATVPDTTVTFALGVKFSAIPTIPGADIVLSDGGEEIGASGDASYPYAVRRADAALYTITNAAGAVTKYYEETNLYSLIALATSGSTIKLYSDIEVGADVEITSKVLNLDLNGYTLTNNSGYIRLYSPSKISIYGGKIIDSNAKELIYLGNGATGAVANITDCVITADRGFAEVRSGELNITDCVYTHGGNFLRFANVASGGNANDKSIVNITGCTMDLGSALLISAERAPSYPGPTDIKITINDSEIKTTANLFHLKNTTAGAADSVSVITVTGETKLAYAKFDGGGATVADTTVTFALGVMFSLEPTITGAKVAFSDGGEGIGASDDAEYPFVVRGDGALYTITTSEGVVTKYYEVVGLKTLVGLAPAGSTITLYSDIDLSDTSETYVKKALTIDLNGYKITNTGERLTVQNGGNLTLKNGTLDDCGTYNGTTYKDKDFLNISNGATNAYIVVDNCDIIGNGFFIDTKGGSVTVKNSTFTQGGKKVGAFINALAAGSGASITVEGCEINVGSARFITFARSASYTAAVQATLTVKDTTVTASGALFNLQNTTTGGSSSTNAITITGNTYLKFSSFDGGLTTYSTTTLSLGKGVKLSAMPTLASGRIVFVDGGEEIKETGDANYPYEVGETAGYLYTVTASDGTVTKYYEAMGLQALVGLAPAGSTITLYADIDLSDTTETYVKKTLVIDLNGHKITNTGERLTVLNGGNLTLKNGTLDDCGTYNGTTYKDKDFVDISNGNNNATIIIDNCDIIGNGCFSDIKGGSITVKNSTFAPGGKKAGTFINALAAGSGASITVEGCEIDVGSASFITLARYYTYTDAVQATITVKDTTVTTSGALFNLQNTTTGGASSTNAITITGNTYLKFGSFDGGLTTSSTTTLTLGKGVMLSAIPTLTKGSVGFTDGAKNIVESDNTDYPYEVINGELMYTVTKSDGSEIKVYKETSLQDLVALADSGSVIKLFSNVTITAEFTIANKKIELDLNGFKVSSAVRGRITGTTELYIHGGTIQDGGADFIFIAAGNNSVVLKIEDCIVNADGKLVDARSGKIEVINSEFTATSGSLFLLASQGSSVRFSATSSSFELGSASLVSTSRGNYTEAALPEISIHNCEATTSGSLFYLKNDYSAAISRIVINITGADTKLSYDTFDGKSCTVPDTTVTIGLGVKMSKLPSVAAGEINLGEGAKGFAVTEDKECPFMVSDKSSITVKPYFSLTLYSDFTLNLCFREADKDSIVKVTVGGVEITPFVANGMVFYPIRDIAAYNAADTKEIFVDYLYDGTALSTVLEYSVIDYANGLLKSNYSTESKEMICRAVDYIKIAYEYAGEDVPEKVTELISGDAYKSISSAGNVTAVPKSETSVGKISNIIESAQIDLGSELRFRFNIKSGVNATLAVKTVTVNETYEIVDGECDGKSFIVVKMRAFDMYDGIITLTSGSDVGTYDLKAYANSDANELDDTGMLGGLILALYNYCREANEYSKVQNKDFRSTASVVVKDGKAGTVTYVVDDGRADSAERLEPMLDDYDNLKLTFGLIANKYATLSTVYNEETGKYEYVRDENGKYVYTVNEAAVEYWRSLVSDYGERIEFANHSFSHVFAGYDDEGGTVSYVDTAGNIKTVTLPVGSATAEVVAAIQILNEVFGVDVEALVMPGVPASRTDVTVNGVTYPGWYEYYIEVCNKLYEAGLLVGMRGDGFHETSDYTKYVILPENFADMAARMSIYAFTVKDTNSVESWKKYIDTALEVGGWANFCLHQIFPDGTVSEAFHLKEWQAKELFAYTDRDDVWVANYSEAAKYYAEWSTAEVSSVYDNGSIKVTLTDSENDALFDEALTVRVTVPSDWNICFVNGGEQLSVKVAESGEHYVLVNIVPDSGVVTLTTK